MGSIKSGARCVRNFDPVYVGLGSKADLGLHKRNVGSAPRSGHVAPIAACPKSAITGLRAKLKF